MVVDNPEAIPATTISNFEVSVGQLQPHTPPFTLPGLSFTTTPSP